MSAEENNKKLNAILSRVLYFKFEEVTDATSLETSAAWDSFNALMLASELEKEFNISFATGELMKIKNVGDIKTILQKNKIPL